MKDWTIRCDVCGKAIYNYKERMQDWYFKVSCGNGYGASKELDICSGECLQKAIDEYKEGLSKGNPNGLWIKAQCEVI